MDKISCCCAKMLDCFDSCEMEWSVWYEMKGTEGGRKESSLELA